MKIIHKQSHANWAPNGTAIEVQMATVDELQKRYDVLFEMYVEHIHDHRLGAGKGCSDCVRLANLEIERRLANEA